MVVYWIYLSIRKYSKIQKSTHSQNKKKEENIDLCYDFSMKIHRNHSIKSRFYPHMRHVSYEVICPSLIS